MEFSSIWWVLFLPLVGFVFQAIAGPILQKQLSFKTARAVLGGIAVAPIALGFLIACALTAKLAGMPATDRSTVVTLFDWIHVQTLSIPFEFRVDPLSMTMVLIITGIGSLIHLYATSYMAEEHDFSRFFTYLNLFIAAMLTLVLGNNLVLLFVGWEGVGVCSYLLIGFWYKDLANSKAANKAFIVNRIGDYGLTLAMFLIVFLVSTNQEAFKHSVTDGRWLSYDVLFKCIPLVMGPNQALVTAIALLLFVGAMGKSAQFPLYVWLPDAMAGPTPVSALIHAATMVTSGVVLLNRMHMFFDASPFASGIVAIIGAITALLGALIAFGQTDIKKVLAFSTVSQLGYMFIACGTGAMWVGMFHVTTHAFFKALLFLGAGAVIHAMAHDQDMRHYGKLLKYLKITGFTMIVGWVAIAGVPPFAGFFSKDEILSSAMNSPLVMDWGSFSFKPGPIVSVIGFVVAILTAAYMTRMTCLTFWSGKERWRDIEPTVDHAHAEDHGDHASEGHAHEDANGFFYTDEEMVAQQVPDEHHHSLDNDHTPHEVPWQMWVPLVVLAVLSIVGGFVLQYVMGFESWLYPKPVAEVSELVPVPVLMGASILCAAIGIGMGWIKYSKGLPENEGLDTAKWQGWRLSAGRQFGIDQFLTGGSLKYGELIGKVSSAFDKTVIDGIVNGVGAIASGLGGLVGRTQTGYVRYYALVLQIGAVALISYFIFVVLRLGGQQ